VGLSLSEDKMGLWLITEASRRQQSFSAQCPAGLMTIF
jgi:hypothetical protein